MDSQDITSYGIAMTTLEEVFIKANGEEREGKKEDLKIEELKVIDDDLNEVQARLIEAEENRSHGSSINRGNQSLVGSERMGTVKVADAQNIDEEFKVDVASLEES